MPVGAIGKHRLYDFAEPDKTGVAIEAGEQRRDVARLEAKLSAEIRCGVRIGQDRHEFVYVTDLERASLSEPFLAQAYV